MVRLYSGATKTEVERMKRYWFPVTNGTDMTEIGDYPGAKIDAVNEYAFISGYSPCDYAQMTGIGMRVIFVPHANAANMYVNVLTDYGKVGEAYNVHSDTTLYNIPTTVNVLGRLIVTPWLSNIEIDDLFGIRLVYNATVTATNMTVLGAYLRWT